MGVYTRRDSPYFWLALPRPGQKPLCESTKIPTRGATPDQAKLLRQQALAVFNARAADLARAHYKLPTKKPTITLEAYSHWFETHKTAKKGGEEQERDRLTLLRRELGAKLLHEIDATLVEEYRTRRLKKVKPSTVNREVTVLRGLLTAAVPKHLDANPIADLADLPEDNYEGRPLYADEEPRLLAVLKPADRVMLLMGMDTLMRQSDILDFEWSRVRGDYGVIPDPKNGELLAVPFSMRLQRALRDVPRTDKAKYLFPERRRGTATQRRSRIRKMLEWACKKAKIPYGRATGGLTWHTATRHTGATRLGEAGHNTLTIQGLGGWKSSSMVKRYSHLDAVKRQAVEDIGQHQLSQAVEARRSPKWLAVRLRWYYANAEIAKIPQKKR